MEKSKQSGFGLMVILLAVMLVIATGIAGYVIYRNNSTYKTPVSNTPVTYTKDTVPKTTKTPLTAPTNEQIENIKAAITSGNTAALEGYMAASVNVILAASEAYGPQTPVQAVKDVDYVSAGTNWDFNLPGTTVGKYKQGDYKQYFQTPALVGKSSNGYVISFQFDNAGKINGIFMTNSESVL